MNECIERDKLRTFAVGEDVIRRMANYKKVEFENTIDSNNDESFQKFMAI